MTEWLASKRLTSKPWENAFQKPEPTDQPINHKNLRSCALSFTQKSASSMYPWFHNKPAWVNGSKKWSRSSRAYQINMILTQCGYMLIPAFGSITWQSYIQGIVVLAQTLGCYFCRKFKSSPMCQLGLGLVWSNLRRQTHTNRQEQWSALTMDVRWCSALNVLFRWWRLCRIFCNIYWFENVWNCRSGHCLLRPETGPFFRTSEHTFSFAIFYVLHPSFIRPLQSGL